MNNRIVRCLMAVFNRIAQFWPSPVVEPVPQDEKPVARTKLTALEEKQERLRHLTRMVSGQMANGLVIHGTPGCGKSATVMSALEDEGADIAVYNSHASPMSLYHCLWESNGKVLVFDDCEGLTRSQACLGLLRSALWSGSGSERLVTYTTTSAQLKAPPSFNFTGRIILILNVVPKNSHCWDAVASRCLTFSLQPSRDELLVLCRRIADRGYKDQLTPEECHQAIDFIEEFSGTRELSLRVLTPAFAAMVYSKTNNCRWQDLLESQLTKLGDDTEPAQQSSRDSDLELLRNLLDAHDTTKAAEEEFTARTGKSRTSFFRLRRQLKEQGASEAITVKQDSTTTEGEAE